MRKQLLLAFASLLSAAALAEARSSNTFALYEIDTSAQQNTIVAVPVTGYGADDDVRIDSLVWADGLTQGDMLLAVTSGVSYAAWSLQPVAGSTTGAMSWQPMSTVQRLDSSKEKRSGIIANNDGTGTIPRGQGLWLIRQNPGTASAKSSFSLFGVWNDDVITVTVRGGSSAAPSYTMLADPSATADLDLNAIEWPDGVGATDTLVVPSDAATNRVYLWDAEKKKWYYAKTSLSDGAITTEYVYNLDKIPAGTGFWYVRRTDGELKITFPRGG